jgi:hypothetical protein
MAIHSEPSLRHLSMEAPEQRYVSGGHPGPSPAEQAAPASQQRNRHANVTRTI